MNFDEIKARLAAATPRPWIHERFGGPHHIGYRVESAAPGEDHGVGIGGIDRGDDANLIAHAPSDIAALLAEVERLTVLLDARLDDPSVVQESAGRWRERLAAAVEASAVQRAALARAHEALRENHRLLAISCDEAVQAALSVVSPMNDIQESAYLALARERKPLERRIVAALADPDGAEAAARVQGLVEALEHVERRGHHAAACRVRPESEECCDPECPTDTARLALARFRGEGNATACPDHGSIHDCQIGMVSSCPPEDHDADCDKCAALARFRREDKP